MSPVTETTVGSVMVGETEPYWTPDLIDYLHAIGSMFEQVDELVLFLEDERGWQIMLDVDETPARALPHLAMYVGEQLPAGIDEVMQREWIRDHPNMQRGTLDSIIRAAQRTLIGDRRVMIVERAGDTSAPNPEDYLAVRTYTADTPDPTAVLRDLRTVVPADIVLDYSSVAGQTWHQAQTTWGPTWTNVQAHYPTWQALMDDKSGFTTWQRPRPT